MTKLQKAILSIIRESDEHFTAEQVYLATKPTVPSVSVSSVYRNLNQFVENKEIRRVVQHDRPDRFEKSLIPHDHALCLICGKMVDVKISKLNEYLTEHCDLEISSFDLIINHTCSNCRTTNKAKEDNNHQ